MIIPGYKTLVQFILLVDILQVAINKCKLNSKTLFIRLFITVNFKNNFILLSRKGSEKYYPILALASELSVYG